MLPYENHILLELLHEDGLIIGAKGLCLERIFLNLLKLYCEPSNLVIVLGTNSKEEEFFIQELKSENFQPLPKSINAEINSNERHSIYMKAGVLFITSRILVVDMLTKRIPIDLITGIVLYKAHKLVAFCQETFILRLFRQQNKTGFIKAFSSHPIAFRSGFCQLSKVMRQLFVKELYLYPRFEMTPKVVEVRLKLTPAMQTIQTALLDLIRITLSEIRQCNSKLLIEELTVENALSSSFMKNLQTELNPIWHQLTPKTCQLVGELKTLHNLLSSLVQTNCVTFFLLVNALKSTELVLKSSGWVFLDAAEVLFTVSKQRIFAENKSFKFEANPKWQALSEILKEIVEHEKNSSKSTCVFVTAYDEQTCKHIRDYLCKGTEATLLDLYNNSRLHLNYGKCKLSKTIDVPNENLFDVIQYPLIVIESLKNPDDPFHLIKILQTLKPTYVIIYDINVTFIRQLEVYQARYPDIALQIYVLIYGYSVEEQAYLSSLQKEKEIFECLIKEKANLVINSNWETHPDLQRDDHIKASDAIMTNNSSQKFKNNNMQSLIVIDIREFRSQLPSFIHRRGIDLEPVGDYILSNDICIERKSLSDLIGSLNSGRLYNQAVAMTRCYARPMILIEFDPDKPFAFFQFSSSRDASSYNIISKLVLFTMHFPTIKLLWSPGPFASAELFQELKIGQSEPDSATATAIVPEEGCIYQDFNPPVFDFVSKLPGINFKNIHLLMNKVKNLEELLTLTEEALADVLHNSENASALYKSLTTTFENECTNQKLFCPDTILKSSKSGLKESENKKTSSSKKNTLLKKKRKTCK